jgi:hypothetical protein
MKQFRLITVDSQEIIVYEKQALKAYYKAKNELIDEVNDEDSDVESGIVTLEYRNVDDNTGAEGEWKVYQEFTLEDDEDDEDLEDIGDDDDDE